MSRSVYGYSDFLLLLNQVPNLRNGVMVDTNVLVTATYESDPNHDQAKEFLDFVIENDVPIFINVNIKNEFLEQHRRIVFTESLTSFARSVDKSALEPDLTARLNKLISRVGIYEKNVKVNPYTDPVRLNDREIKDFKSKLTLVVGTSGKNLWSVLCDEHIGNKLSEVWRIAEKQLGLNYLGARGSDSQQHFARPVIWEHTVDIMEKHGLSSSDAMILNLFLASTFEALITCDEELARTAEVMTVGSKYFCFR